MVQVHKVPDLVRVVLVLVHDEEQVLVVPQDELVQVVPQEERKQEARLVHPAHWSLLFLLVHPT